MFVLFGFFIHLIFLFSIFDIYFKSPIVREVPPYIPQHDAGANRLVLFVIDGLRAESFVNYTTMPYLRSIASHNGRWGISSTRVPTESRPGHVAIISGFYEDPSAVTKGWKENPVDFDSVFNQSTYTWCWGAYDIIEIFTKGTVNNHIYANKFDPYNQTFSTDKNTTLLDSWVFESVKDFFNNAKSNKKLKTKLNNEKIIFFLHLLGTDTAGHTHKPKTKNYITNLEHVDEGVKQMVDVIEHFFDNDKKTSYLMTSDHGMTDWGSHGAGDKHETETPYVLWGSGTQLIDKSDELQNIKGKLPNKGRVDINQADLAPLMSTILSIPVPVNSVGQLPLDLLNLPLSEKAKAVYSNSRQLASQYNKKRLDIESNALSFLYQPYDGLDQKKYEEILEHTETLLSQKQYDKVILLSKEISNLCLSGLVYYHNYYQRPLLVLITLSFVGWIMYLLHMLLIQKISTQLHYSNKIINRNISSRKIIDIVAVILTFAFSFVLFVQNLPIQYYVYSILPIYLWWRVLSSWNLWSKMFSAAQSQAGWLFIIEVISYILGAVFMGLSFTHRWMLSIPLLGMAIWPLLSRTRKHLPSQILLLWTGSCLLLSMFSFMPVVGKDVHIELVMYAGVIWIGIHLYYIWKCILQLYTYGKVKMVEFVYNLTQILLLVIAILNVYVQSKRFEQGTPVSYSHQMIAWCIAGLSLVFPLTSNQRIICRLSSINISALTFYLLLSVAHEGLFFVTLLTNVMCWVSIEHTLIHKGKTKLIDFTFSTDLGETTSDKNDAVTPQERSLIRQDFRRGFFFLLYIIVSFFGTGNIASLNSFEVRWVTCFITSYQPFVIMTLILLKTLMPFIIVSCSFRAIQVITKAPTGYLNIIVLIFSNIMGIQLLFQVKNTGSWLEIGTSISQFVIVQVITLFIVLLHQFAKIFTQLNVCTLHKVFKSRKKYV